MQEQDDEFFTTNFDPHLMTHVVAVMRMMIMVMLTTKFRYFYPFLAM